jgi:acyl transferase domain-containing protein
VAAAQIARGLSLSDAAKVICRRSTLMGRTTGGMMAVVALSPEEAGRAIAGYGGAISVAAHNSPSSTVLSGDATALETVLTELERQDVYCGRVAVAAASHSASMEPVSATLRTTLPDLSPQPTSRKYYSTLLGKRAPGVLPDAAYWADNVRQPVLFAQAVEAAVADGCTVFVEISPHPVLVSSLKRCHDAVDVVGSLSRGRPAQTCLAEALADAYAAGADVDWAAYYPHPRPVADLPGYAWQHDRLWSLPEDTASPKAVLRRRSDTLPQDEPRPELATGSPVIDELAGDLALILKSSAHRVPVDVSLRSIGVDSLLAAEFRLRIARRWGVDLPLSSILLGGTTLADLALAIDVPVRRIS